MGVRREGEPSVARPVADEAGVGLVGGRCCGGRVGDEDVVALDVEEGVLHERDVVSITANSAYRQEKQHETTYLCKVGCALLVIIQVNQVGLKESQNHQQTLSKIKAATQAATTHLRPKRPQPRALQHLPPAQELLEALIPDMDLDLQLAEGEGLPGGDVRLDERGERLELPAFDVDFQDVDVFVALKRKKISMSSSQKKTKGGREEEMEEATHHSPA